MERLCVACESSQRVTTRRALRYTNADAMRASWPAWPARFGAVVVGALLTAMTACGTSTIHVVGVMHRSSEMRPLPSVPLEGYQQLHVLVRAEPGQEAERYGSPDCGFAPL